MSGPGPLTRAANLVDVEHTEESIGRVRAEAYAFLLGGGVVTLRDWEGLQPEERDALTHAGQRLMQERAGAILGVFQPTEGDVVRSMIEAGLVGVQQDEHASDPSGG